MAVSCRCSTAYLDGFCVQDVRVLIQMPNKGSGFQDCSYLWKVSRTCTDPEMKSLKLFQDCSYLWETLRTCTDLEMKSLKLFQDCSYLWEILRTCTDLEMKSLKLFHGRHSPLHKCLKQSCSKPLLGLAGTI